VKTKSAAYEKTWPRFRKVVAVFLTSELSTLSLTACTSADQSSAITRSSLRALARPERLTGW